MSCLIGQDWVSQLSGEILMSRDSLIALAVVSTLLVVFRPSQESRGDGFIVIERPYVPDGPHVIHMPPRVVHFPLEVKKHIVTADIHDTVGNTKVDQIFHNPNSQQMEGTYMFPLPETAAVQKFSMWMNGKEVQGELLDAEKARSIYEDIVRKMKDPALLEYMGSRLYKARVFPIPANGDVRIALEYTETINVQEGQGSYRYPLNTEKFSAKDIEEVAINVILRSQVTLKNVFCSSHNATVSRPNDHEARISFEARQVKPDQDFVVHYQMSEKEFGLSLLSFKPSGEDGFFMARIAPPVSTTQARITPKDVCFVVDTSGSMAGDKINQARKAMTFCVSSLRPDDRFNVISFASETRPFRPSLIPATRENIEAALADIDKIAAAGGTNINDALLEAIKAKAGADGDRPYMIVFMTDGEPTVGEREPATIQANVNKANARTCRLFVFGIGHDLNTKLLDRLAEDNRGAREYIEEKEDIEVKVSSFFRKVSDPVLSDMELRFPSADVYDLYPKQLPDLFYGGELVMVGRYRKAGRDNVAIRGKRQVETLTWEYPAQLADARTENEFLPRLWATRKIGYLIDDIRLRGENKEVKDEIVALAKRYAILTPYTSYLVVEDSDKSHVTGIGGHQAAPAVRYLWGAMRRDDKLGSSMRSAGESQLATSGGAAVDASKNAISLQAGNFSANMDSYYDRLQVAGAPLSPTGAPTTQQSIKTVGAKTFYLDNGRWIDSEYDNKAVTRKVKAFSQEYFDLLRATPELRKYVALGTRLVVLWAQTVYEIVE